jgi:hypothetical protein
MASSGKGLTEVEQALNRFAQKTDTDGSALTVEFKNFNKRRVDDFVHDPFNEFEQKESIKARKEQSRRVNTKTKTDIAGVLLVDACLALPCCAVAELS